MITDIPFQAIDLQTQEELTSSIQKNIKPAPKQRLQPQTQKQSAQAKVVSEAQRPDSSNSPTLLPLDKLNSSPAFTVLRHAVDGDLLVPCSTADQPVFPMPTLLGDNKVGALLL